MNKYLFLKTVLVVFTCSMVTAGCSNEKNSGGARHESTGNETSAVILEPCMLITKTEAAEILGKAVNDAETSEKPVTGMKLCLYKTVNDDSADFLQVTISQPAFMSAESKASGQSPGSVFTSLKNAFSDSRNDISGIGDDAFIATPGLHILKGDYYVTIEAGNIDRDDVRKKLLIAGKTLTDKLP